ncbi:hypothetical protein JXJ21_03395 [candidate division KSB1 bacterium]|nr:hypothetical protein [candidate division KSB1 bacterium]
MKKYIAFIGLLVCLFVACDKKEPTKNEDLVTIEDLLVKNNEITGWTYSGESWVANNISELTNYINGEAEIYNRHGFLEAARQTYAGKIDNGNRSIKLTIYNQQTESNARDVYNDEDLGMSAAITWQNGAGSAAHTIRFGLSQALTFYRKQYYVHLDINYDTDESLTILKQFALNVDGKLK